jgi:hypothetical protein
MKRDSLERQLESAKTKLAARVSVMDKAGIKEDARRRDPAWRTLDATRRSLITRLGCVSKIETRDAEAVTRKAAAESDSASDDE